MPGVMQETLKRHLCMGKTIGFVPTMGALHEGHLSLIRRAKSENEIVVVSIFVNPLQFGAGEDFEEYPRDINNDMEKLRELNTNILFMPGNRSLYPEGFASRIVIDNVSDRLCGQFRPGHFSGVGTVVCKLFNIVKPTRAYFGQKDFQQAVVIGRMVEDLNMDIKVITCPTVRENDGLAMSSRNIYLGPKERLAAPVLYKALSLCSQVINNGSSGPEAAREKLVEMLRSEPLVSEIQYAGIYDPGTLLQIDAFKQQNLVAAAIRIGGVRLIDNVVVSKNRP